MTAATIRSENASVTYDGATAPAVQGIGLTAPASSPLLPPRPAPGAPLGTPSSTAPVPPKETP